MISFISDKPQNNVRNDITLRNFGRGVKVALPVLLGYLPVGFAFGVLAIQAGMTPLSVGFMSLLVYAGSSQFIALDLMAGGTSILAIIMVTFIVNLRHLLMSAALIPYLRPWSRPLQAFYSFEMTDETFALCNSRFYQYGVNTGETLGINFIAHQVWIFASIGGAVFGNIIGDVRAYGLDYALSAMFMGLLLPHLRIPPRLVAAFAGGGLSVLFALAGFEQWNVVLSTVAGASVALVVPRQTKRSRG